MTDMKCPFCQQELQETYDGKQFWCSNYKDPTHPINMLGTKELWQELIRTKELLEIESSEHELCHDAMVKRTEEVNQIRKALDIALDALKEINDRYESEEQRGREEDDSPDWWDFSMDTGEILTKALEQITALEQKDGK